MTDGLLQRITENAGMQKAQLDSFARQLVALTRINEGKAAGGRQYHRPGGGAQPRHFAQAFKGRGDPGGGSRYRMKWGSVLQVIFQMPVEVFVRSKGIQIEAGT